MKRQLTVFLLLALLPITLLAQVSLGDNVPNFSAINQDGEKWTLNKHLHDADYLVIYFYPAAFTGGCTKQACTYRDQKGELSDAGAQVVGVSGDEPETLGLFALENQLNFTLLSDEEGEIARLFDVPHNEGGTITREVNGRSLDLTRATTIQRWTFILDKKGKLIYKDSEVDATQDSQKVVSFLSSL